MELINKEELRDKMYHESFEVDSEMQKWDSGCWVRYKLFEKILDEMPTVESRPKGEWIKKQSAIFNFHKCSNCGEDAFCDDVQGEELSNFCPHCGADMRGEQ